MSISTCTSYAITETESAVAHSLSFFIHLLFYLKFDYSEQYFFKRTVLACHHYERINICFYLQETDTFGKLKNSGFKYVSCCIRVGKTFSNNCPSLHPQDVVLLNTKLYLATMTNRYANGCSPLICVEKESQLEGT